MKTTFDIPDDLYRQMAARTAAEGRSLREVALDLFRSYLGADKPIKPAEGPARATSRRSPPVWFGIFKEQARKVGHHDMDAIRRSIARGAAQERDL